MRRRETRLSFKLPARLSTYNAADWEGRDDADRYGEWMMAREKWKDDREIYILPDDAAAMAAFPDGEWRLEDL
jgi:hypothetical protein